MIKKGQTSVSKRLGALFLSVFLLLANAYPSFAQTSENPAEVTYHLDGTKITDKRTFSLDTTADLTVDSKGKSLLKQKHTDGYEYDLDSVTVTRHRRPVKIQYYLGDFIDNQLLVTDEGYLDYGDRIGDYILYKNQLEQKFNLTLPACSDGYAVLSLDPSGSSIFNKTPEAYNSSSPDEPIVVKALVAPIQRLSANERYYQNRQGAINPDPTGSVPADNNSNSIAGKYWRVASGDHSYVYIRGETVNIKKFFSVEDTFNRNGRIGTLKYMGYYDSANGNKFNNSDTITLTDEVVNNLSLGFFYDVPTYLGEPESDPGSGFRMGGSTSIPIVGPQLPWKSETTSETIPVSDLAKLQAYPFNLNGDAFDTPDHTLDPALGNNFMLAHQISLSYNYTKGAQYALFYNLAFDVNGGDETGKPADQQVLEGLLATEPTVPTRSGYTFLGWNTEADASGTDWNFSTTTMPANDVTLYAQWQGNDSVVNVRHETEDGTLLYSETLKGRVGEEYSAPFYTFEGYTLLANPDNYKGTFTEQTIDVVFVYKGDVVKTTPTPMPNEAPTPTQTSDPQNSTPTTGDNTNVILLVALLAVSLIGVVFVVIKKKKTTNR